VVRDVAVQPSVEAVDVYLVCYTTAAQLFAGKNAADTGNVSAWIDEIFVEAGNRCIVRSFVIGIVVLTNEFTLLVRGAGGGFCIFGERVFVLL
jgi:hypothetical protein